MWGDEKFRQLSGTTAWPHFARRQPGPHTRALPGLFSIGEAGLAEVLGWPLRGFRAARRELEAQGIVKADWLARIVWIPNALKHNPPESPNVVRRWRATVDEMPECALKIEAVAMLGS